MQLDSAQMVLRFAKTKEETPIIISKVGQEQWASSAPMWYVPLHRISALQKYGLNLEIPGRYILCGEVIEYEGTAYPNFNQLIKPASYSEVLIPNACSETLVHFNDGDYGMPRKYFEFITRGQKGLSYRYNPQRKRIGVFDNARCIGACIGKPVIDQFNINKCIVCDAPGQYIYYSKDGRNHPVCSEDHEIKAIQRMHTDSLLEDWGFV